MKVLVFYRFLPKPLPLPQLPFEPSIMRQQQLNAQPQSLPMSLLQPQQTH